MRATPPSRPTALLALALALVFTVHPPGVLIATDVDGPDDCLRETRDFGDAPEEALAYPGVPGHFPTCTFPTGPGTQELACPSPGTPPGPTGYIRHENLQGGYWLGCGPVGTAPLGIDSEPDGKMNASGASTSVCNPNVLVDCVEAAFGINFGQDECYGSSDAGVASLLTFGTCTSNSFDFRAYNCATAPRTVFLNVCVDLNQDGDWNDTFACSATACALEWAVRNVTLTLQPGCNNLTSPGFLAGPHAGFGWLRISLTDAPVPDDYPWNGSAGVATGYFRGGETEDYPVEIRDVAEPCGSYEDWGDAPEKITAYPNGNAGHFPTCLFLSGPGTQELACAPISTPPGPTGHVRHVSAATDNVMFWLGCGDPTGSGFPGVDGEPNGKVNVAPPLSDTSSCDPILVDCHESAFGGGTDFGQDECFGDFDAGLKGPVEFEACRPETLTFTTFNCRTVTDAFVNVCVDWNEDGDWNDNFLCPGQTQCVYEWSVKNLPVTLLPGCQVHQVIVMGGPRRGNGWLRLTVTASPVSDDFPWAGSGATAADFFRTGETEDYPVTITGDCDVAYTDYGDAPEEILAYPGGPSGHFPTCIFPTGPGTLNLYCHIQPPGTAPGPTGFVRHAATATNPVKMWLGCGTPGTPGIGVDSEVNGKVNDAAVMGSVSVCQTGVIVDCVEPAFTMNFGQDECYGDGDAGVASFIGFRACTLNAFRFEAFNCSPNRQDAYLNVLVDWNRDADWNDVLRCSPQGICTPEWALKNVLITLDPGCGSYTTPAFMAGPKITEGWLRISISERPAPDDFPWNGSVSLAGQQFDAGETEDYPIRVIPSTVGVDENPAPERLWMGPIMPNPGSRSATARFALPREAEVSLAAYDVSGRKIRELVQGVMPAGDHAHTWDYRDAAGQEVPAGIYLVKLSVGGETLTQRVIRVR